MAEKLYDLSIKNGSYTKNGEEKNRYVSIGAVFNGEHGKYMILDRHINIGGFPNPENRTSLIVNMFKPREKADGAAMVPSQDATRSFEDDSIPF